MRVACIQMRSGCDVDANLQMVDQLVMQAASQGARYIQTPEMTSLVQAKREQLLHTIQRDEDGGGRSNAVVEFMRQLAKREAVWLHVGSIAVLLPNDKAANRSLLFSPNGTLIARYDKLHMFDVDLPNGETWRESLLYQPGKLAKLVEIEPFSLGMSICYDLRFPALFSAYANAGAQVLSCPAAFTKQTGEAHWHVLLRTRAIENGAFVVAAAQGGIHEDGRETYGHSLIINPWGKIIGELAHNKPDVLICDLDLGEVDEARSRIPNLMNASEFQMQIINREKLS